MPPNAHLRCSSLLIPNALNAPPTQMLHEGVSEFHLRRDSKFVTCGSAFKIQQLSSASRSVLEPGKISLSAHT